MEPLQLEPFFHAASTEAGMPLGLKIALTNTLASRTALIIPSGADFPKRQISHSILQREARGFTPEEYVSTGSYKRGGFRLSIDDKI